MDRRIALPLAGLALLAVTGAGLIAAGSHTPPAARATASAPTPPDPAASAPGAVVTEGAVAPAVLAYVDAVNAGDLDALVQAFAADAVITDVSRQISGHDAIRTWADREVVGGSLQVLDVIEDRPDGQLLLVHWAPGGSGGWRAHYDFTVSGNRVTAADLQYA
jgi:hypothetical protein